MGCLFGLLLFSPKYYQPNHHTNYKHNNHNRHPDSWCDQLFSLNSRSFLGRGYLRSYQLWFGFNLKRPAYVSSCCKRPFYILWLSPREPAGAASPIRKSKSPVILAVFAFDMQFRRRWPVAVTGQLNTLTQSPGKILTDIVVPSALIRYFK